MQGFYVILLALPWLAQRCAAQEPQYPPAFPPTPILPSSINYAPSVTPNIEDPTAPDAQTVCPGYTASNVQTSDSGITVDLTLAGKACNVYGFDIPNLTLVVAYQSRNRLSVRIVPKYLGAKNYTQYILSPDYTPQPDNSCDAGSSNSDLVFQWSNTPSFQFQVIRKSDNNVLFDTSGNVIVFEDQFLELKTSMVPNYNVYGLAENLHSFRLGNNYTQTFWNSYNLTNDQVRGAYSHSTHPMYLETRYANGTSTSHGVYGRNAHGQDWLLRSDYITYRTIGGSFDFYFLSGPKPKDVISQYQTGIVSTPYIPPYWNLGFMQVRWGYQNWTNLQAVLDLYAAQDIQVEAIMNDLDYLDLNRVFTDSAGYNLTEGKEFLDALHARGQYYCPILDPNIYVPNKTEAYPPYTSGAAMDAFIRNGNDGYYTGVEWTGFNVWPDFQPHVPQAQQFWTDQITQFHDKLDFDGFWLDVNDATSFCTYSCGTGIAMAEDPIHVPFALPGDANTSLAVDYMYPEGFAVTNASEAASASAALASQSAMYPMQSSTPTPTYTRTQPTMGVRNLNFPPYAINAPLDGHSLVKQVITPNATSNDGPYNSTQYELHNLYGHFSGNATYHALLATKPGIRPFFVSRSTFAGSGAFAGHWGGDTNSAFGDMYYGIAQALQFSIAGIPYFGVETCGFNGNADLELCTRWMQLSAWYPFYRNHNNRNTIAQEAYRWATAAASTRVIMDVRYSLLPYTYTLFARAHQRGETVLRALAWEFPDDPSLAAVETQFMSGPAILVTPVLAPLATTVRGVFPGVAQGQAWYDWYTLQKVQVAPGENKTLDAPLEHQPIHVRAGYIIPMQKAGNTTKTSRQNPWSLLVAAAQDGTTTAVGDLYEDDGVSLHPSATKEVVFSWCNANSTLTVLEHGSYNDGVPLANVTVAGFSGPCDADSVTLQFIGGGSNQKQQVGHVHVADGTLYITGLAPAFQAGAWSHSFTLQVQ
ncbi:extracellular alpha-glucosidase aglu [Microdochium trichocladiopsis]|uniref:alpha-glucosidase n=1 Tax=Microdochium trichocladiopsis TaxID=1682393 RepID=A0A9P8YGT0_9PEZI|nr:extracellular alpha-glucosidase aglu [Microdochium trichocladiopsis]KAH7039727.1 extracellular alpha-glucosidase aglu [Microdochium trichocladiopsis]